MALPQPTTCARALAIVAASGALLAACSGGSKRAAVPTPVASAQASAAGATAAPATPTPADRQLADKLRGDGDFEGAINVYGAVAANSSGETRQQARVAQAQLLAKTGRAAEAKPVLQSYVADAGTAADGTAGQYMLASALDDTGDIPGAIAAYERYIAAGGVLADFARLERAKLLARSGRVAEAEAAGEEVLASGLLPQFKASFLFSMGKAFELGQADVEALAWYGRAQAGGDVASALARIGAVKKRLGDASWVSDYARAVNTYPDSGVASDLLDELDAAGAPVSDYTRGVVYYLTSRDALARAALLRAIAADDRAARATYYLAALDERAGDTEAAIAGYGRAHDLDPASDRADDALWWRGQLLEHAGRFGEASASYADLVASYPASPFAGDADFHRGMVLYRTGDFAGAASMWAVVAAASNGSDALRARFWGARASIAAKDPAGQAALKQLQADAPDDFYGLRAEVLLKKNDTRQRKPKLDQKTTDWGKIADYLKDAKGIDPRTDTRAGGDPLWPVAAELRLVGLTAQSDAVAATALKNELLDPSLLYADAKAADESGDASLAARAATALLEYVKDAPRPPPADLLRVAYPLAYRDLAADAANTEDISPLLLLALVRQESFYEPDAGSGAGALGLTQVVPTTGETIAATLGVMGFKPEDLYRPKLSLQFGANYLGAALKQFDGNPYHALAAYNGGPGTASNAAKLAGDDEDLFVEDLEFDETRLYVRLVMENYARYRQLYEGLDRPSLPE